jgi:hypothetical protein
MQRMHRPEYWYLKILNENLHEPTITDIINEENEKCIPGTIILMKSIPVQYYEIKKVFNIL